MESLPLVNPPTLSRAASAGPRRNSMEDSDSSLTRKRPRLDSGSRSYRSMSADRIAPSTPTMESGAALTTPSRSGASLKETSESNTVPVLEGTPSRVTINVKDPAHQDSHLTSTAQEHRRRDDHDTDRDELASSSDLEPSKRLTSPSPNIISPSSSPSRSPEIEVAEVEDINQEPGHTKWRTLGSLPDPASIRDDLWARFPCRDRTQNVLETVDEIIRHFHQRKSATRVCGCRLLIRARTNRGRYSVSKPRILDKYVSLQHQAILVGVVRLIRE